MSPQEGRLNPIHLRYRQRRIFAREVSGRSEIAAPVDVVWRALTDFERYGEWNTFCPKAETDLEVGSPIKMHVVMPGRASGVRTEWINLVEPGKTVCWGMHLGHPALLCANRWQILRALDDDRTEYFTVDYFSGLLTPLMMALFAEPMRLGFQSVADNLKQWVESQNENLETNE